MKITSLAFGDNLPVPVQYTCAGLNTSPPFEFLEVPEGCTSLTLIVEDLDSPDNRIHWLVYNIPGDVTHFDEGCIPEGAIQGICNKGTRGYEGPCPKYFSGLRRYSFTLYALNTLLNAPPNADTEVVLAAMENHILAKATLTGLAEGEMNPV